MSKSGWVSIQLSKTEYHVYPLNDLVTHILTKECECHPRVQVVEGAGEVIVHNSWDEREFEEYFEKTKGDVIL